MGAEPDVDLRICLSEALKNETASRTDDVVIAGGGIAGLTLALALSRHGVASHVLERRAAFSEEGAGIQIGPNGTRILSDLGIAELLRPHVGTPDWLIVHDAMRGTVLSRMPLNAAMPARFGSPYWTVHREDLHAALLTHVRARASIRVTQAADIAVAAQAETLAGIVTREGAVYAGRAAIGADGLRSLMRESVGGPVSLTPIGKSAYRTVVQASGAPPAIADGNVHIWLAPDAHVVHYPVRAGSEIAVVIIANAPYGGEGWSHDAQSGVGLDRLHLASELQAFLASAPRWRRWSLVTPDRGIAMARGRLALAGDAAHPVLPFLAQGGVLAMEDAVVLANLLAKAGVDVSAALQVYAGQRQARVRRVAEAARRNGRIYHLTGAGRVARNTAFRLVPGVRLMSAYDWVYGWRA